MQGKAAAGVYGYGYGYPKEKGGKKDAWVMCDCDCELRSPPRSPVAAAPLPTPPPAPKAVDEDLYKISPHLLRQHAKRVPPILNSVFSLHCNFIMKLHISQLFFPNNSILVFLFLFAAIKLVNLKPFTPQ